MVYKGMYHPGPTLDPHFSQDQASPFARFQPTAEGWKAACELAASFK